VVNRRRAFEVEASEDHVYAAREFVARRSAKPRQFTLAGLIDSYNATELAKWLRLTVTGVSYLRGGTDIYLEVGQLQFGDVSGIHALVAAARDLDGGRRLIVHGLPQQISAAMRLVGWTDLPSLVIADRRRADAAPDSVAPRRGMRTVYQRDL
jgi:anti-anti-sigma regulatory factor